MKQFRSKSVGVQRKALKLSIERVRKVHNEFRELSYRDFRGGEMAMAAEVRAARDHLVDALDTLRCAEENMASLEKMIAAKGK